MDFENEFDRQMANQILLSKEILTVEELILKTSILKEKVANIQESISAYDKQVIFWHRQPAEHQNVFDLAYYETEITLLRADLKRLFEQNGDIDLGSMYLSPQDMLSQTLSYTIQQSKFKGDFQKSSKLEKVKDWAQKNGIYLVD